MSDMLGAESGALSLDDYAGIVDVLRGDRKYAPDGAPERRLWKFAPRADGALTVDGLLVLPGIAWPVATAGAALAARAGETVVACLRRLGIFAGGTGGRTPV